MEFILIFTIYSIGAGYTSSTAEFSNFERCLDASKLLKENYPKHVRAFCIRK